MHVSLSSKTEKLIQSHIEDGAYKNASEMLEASVELMVEYRRQLDDAIQEGIDDIEAGRFSSGEEVYDRLKNIIDKKR